MWSIGDITYGEITYSNVVALYHIDSKNWSLLSFPTEFRVFSSYIDGTTLKIAAGNDDGEIIEVFTGEKDNKTGSLNIGIQYSINYRQQELGDRSKLKEISSVVPYVDNGLGTILSLRINNSSGFKEKGSVNNEFGNKIQVSEKGYLFEFRFAGACVGGKTEIIGFDVTTPDLTRSIKT